MGNTRIYGANDIEKGEEGYYFSQRELENYTPISCLKNIIKKGSVKALEIDVKMTLDHLATGGSPLVDF